MFKSPKHTGCSSLKIHQLRFVPEAKTSLNEVNTHKQLDFYSRWLLDALIYIGGCLNVLVVSADKSNKITPKLFNEECTNEGSAKQSKFLSCCPTGEVAGVDDEGPL